MPSTYKHGFSALLIIITIGILAVGTVSYIYFNGKKSDIARNTEVSPTLNPSVSNIITPSLSVTPSASPKASNTNLVKKFFDEYRFSVSYPKDWIPVVASQPPYYSVANFYTATTLNKDTNPEAYILFTNDPGQVDGLLKDGPLGGGYDPRQTQKYEINERGLHGVLWDYFTVGDAGSGTGRKKVWIVIKDCDIDSVYEIDDITLFKNFALLDANGNESSSANYRQCAPFDPTKPYNVHREK